MPLSNNYCVDFTDCNSIVNQKSTPPYDGNREVWKSALLQYYYADASYLTSYADNQLVAYQDIHQLPNVNVNIYGKKSATGGSAIYVWYSFDGSTWYQMTTALSTSCSLIGTISNVPSGQTIYFLGQTAGEAVTYATNGTAGASCPSYTTSCGTAYSIQVSTIVNQVALSINKAYSC